MPWHGNNKKPISFSFVRFNLSVRWLPYLLLSLFKPFRTPRSSTFIEYIYFIIFHVDILEKKKCCNDLLLYNFICQFAYAYEYFDWSFKCCLSYFCLFFCFDFVLRVLFIYLIFYLKHFYFGFTIGIHCDVFCRHSRQMCFAFAYAISFMIMNDANLHRQNINCILHCTMYGNARYLCHFPVEVRHILSSSIILYWINVRLE